MATPKKKPEERLKMGRPTIYTEELADLICKRVATCTLGLARLCAKYDDMPDRTTINEWRYEKPDFSARYAQAKLFQTELLAEEIIDISDDATNDYMESLGEDGQPLGYKLNGEHVQRSRLRVDTRKFLAIKLLPKQYGDKPDAKDANDKSAIEKLIDKLVE